MLRTYKQPRRESEKGKAKRLEFEAAERQCLKAAKYICQARVPGVCMTRATVAHHRKLRSQGGDNSQENLTPMCICCHRWAHSHPAECYENGMMVRRDER